MLQQVSLTWAGEIVFSDQAVKRKGQLFYLAKTCYLYLTLPVRCIPKRRDISLAYDIRFCP